jgi:malonyl-CoA/methylmalonyl-CoA synthetase
MNGFDVFARGFADRHGATFLEDGTCRYSYADLDRESARHAVFLRDLGLVPGDRVAAQIDKSPQAIFLYLGVLRAGLAYLPLNTDYQRGELAYFLNDAEPRLVVCREASKDVFGELLKGRDHTHLRTLDATDGGSLPAVVADVPAASVAAFRTVARAEDDLALIIYTSGTTGRSKGAMVTHGNIASNAAVLKDHWRISADDVLIHALPLFHVHGLFVALHPLLLAGASLLLHRRFDPRAVLADFARATLLMGVPTFYVRLLAEPGLTPQACSHMRLFISGSAPLLPDTFDGFRARSGHTILERYGMSEAGMITSNPCDGERRRGTVGPPLPGNSVRVVDMQGKPLPALQPGDVQIKGPNVFKGYWRMPEKTREEFTADGWFRTGDIGQFDADGYLAIVGRAKDLIISGGYNVYPKEVELVLDQIPGVVESAVVGVLHPDFGEAVTAVLVVGPDFSLSEADVIAMVKAELAGYKVPKRVQFVADLPRNAMGKVQKAGLRKDLRTLYA